MKNSSQEGGQRKIRKGKEDSVNVGVKKRRKTRQ